MLLLSLISIFPILPPATALHISSCIKYEICIATLYKMAPLAFSDSFTHSVEYSPRKLTKIGFRSRRLFGYCDSGYTYVGFPSYSCLPFCFGGCQLDAHCSAPNQCTCDYGYHKNADHDLCVSNDTIDKAIETRATTTVLMKTTSSKTSCNGYCPSNEICSLTNDVCICQNGFRRSIDGLNCVPNCDNGCQNSDCTSPNTCTCWPHYEKTNDSSCHLKCTEALCTFGVCNKNGVCICAEGFFNNGTNCIWAGDDVFSEPDYCECWSKFIWQTNVTEGRCMHSCDDEGNSQELKSDCIPFKECEFYEGYTICQSQIYKCIDKPELSTLIPQTDDNDRVSENITSTSTELIVTIVGLTTLLLVVVVSLWIWKIRRNSFNRLWSYNTMENPQEEEQF